MDKDNKDWQNDSFIIYTLPSLIMSLPISAEILISSAPACLLAACSNPHRETQISYGRSGNTGKTFYRKL
ncbi:hypothetical protein [Neisseria musculi]|uniref:hypothetical protein n=1 Tax=Neisseria musculi TaxID=1815583 RepID=UPI00110520F9|nr:hypothetical protein [Neisseria musculi]TFU43678.1 hypothetical protein E4T99_04390 [Neisseria sp. WF04]